MSLHDNKKNVYHEGDDNDRATEVERDDSHSNLIDDAQPVKVIHCPI